jgi:hypothetical protein
MIRRDTVEFHADGVLTRPSATAAKGALVGTHGAFEQTYHRHQQRNTMHLCAVAELADDLDPSALDAGLLAGTGHTCCDVVAEELTRPIDTSSAPMIRVVLLHSGPPTPAAIVLTVADVIIDGLSAGYVLRSSLRCCGVQPRRLQCLARSKHELSRVPPSRARGSDQGR